MEKALPVGLILNELVTNAIKYAFPQNRSGNIQVRLFRSPGELCVAVADDGVGPNSPNGASAQNTTTSPSLGRTTREGFPAARSSAIRVSRGRAAVARSGKNARTRRTHIPKLPERMPPNACPMVRFPLRGGGILDPTLPIIWRF